MPVHSSHLISRRSLSAGAALFGATAALGRIAWAQERPGASPAASPVPGSPTLLLRMENIGGPNAPDLHMVAVPEFSLYDDGSIYRLGPVIAIFPPPALPNVTRMRVSPEAVGIIMERAREAGLDQAREIPNPTMQDDVPSTRFWFNAGDRIEISIAWGIFADVQPLPDWDDATLTAYQQLRDFASYLANVPFNLPEETVLEPEMPIDPERLQVISFEAAPDLALPSGIPDLSQPPLTWPLSTPLEELSAPYHPMSAGLPEPQCAVITGADVQAVVETSRQGNLLSPWMDGDTTYGVLLTPLLPGQAGCEAPESP